jgi:hypothetical protein
MARTTDTSTHCLIHEGRLSVPWTHYCKRGIQARKRNLQLSLSRPASYVPAVPSPLNTASSHSSTGDSNGKTDGEDGEEVSPLHNSSSTEAGSRSTSKEPSLTETSKKIGTLSPAQQMLRQKTASTSLSQDIRSEIPRRLYHLGRKYSRYPIPSNYLRSHSDDPAAKNSNMAPSNHN